MDTVVNITESVIFTCSARGVPLPAISWYRNGSTLDPAAFNISQTTNGTYSVSSVLFLASLVLSDAGTYSCNASHDISGSDARQFTFTVQSKQKHLVHYVSSS